MDALTLLACPIIGTGLIMYMMMCGQPSNSRARTMHRIHKRSKSRGCAPSSTAQRDTLSKRLPNQ